MANNLKEKVSGGLSDLRTYWKIPKPGKYIPYREIAAYSGGGIGAYMVITLGMQCLACC